MIRVNHHQGQNCILYAYSSKRDIALEKVEDEDMLSHTEEEKLGRRRLCIVEWKASGVATRKGKNSSLGLL